MPRRIVPQLSDQTDVPAQATHSAVLAALPDVAMIIQLVIPGFQLLMATLVQTIIVNAPATAVALEVSVMILQLKEVLEIHAE